jgi:P27 family predicted phage terminase small subunit
MPTPRKPILLHELHGTKPHDRASETSHVPPGRPKFPSDLPFSSKRVFKRLCATLAERRSLTAGDMDLIRLYCIVHDRHATESKLLREEGCIVAYTRLDSNGQPHQQFKENLRLKVVQISERQMVDILTRLGLTPTAKDRAKPVGPVVNKDDIVPGSIADTHPELLAKVIKQHEEMKRNGPN